MLVTKKHSKIIKIAVGLLTMTLAIFLLSHFALAATGNFFGNDTGTNFANNAGLPGAGIDLVTIIANVIKIFIGFLGIIAVIMIMYGGFLWMTSGGDEQKIEQAKNVLKNAVIGLILIMLSFIIVNFIFSFFGGGNGGGDNQPGTPPGNVGLGALGNGIVESTYPARNQRDVPRNTSIIVTFREAMQLDTLCDNVDTTDPLKPICNGAITATHLNESKIANNNVRIFKLADESKCLGKALGTCPTVNAKVYSTSNKKTFVFIPDTYLGSPSEPINYAVFLTSDIKKADGKYAFAGSFSRGYEWPFEVSTRIDLTPPQVLNGGVFPAPDVSRDDYTVGSAQAAKWQIQVNRLPGVDTPAGVTKIDQLSGPAAGARVTINPNCQQNGTLNVTIASSGGLVAQLFALPVAPATVSTPLGQGIFGQNSLGYKNITFTECNLVLTLNRKTVIDVFSAGNGWNISVTKGITADTLAVGSTVYTFVYRTTGSGSQQIVVRSGSMDNIDVANNIVSTLSSNKEVLVVLPRSRNNIINLQAIVAGAAGNNIELNTSNTGALAISSTLTGADKPVAVTVKGRRDKPMNATIQIEFNEAIMPLQVSGSADEVHNYIRVVNANRLAQAAGGNCLIDADCRSFACDEVTKKCKARIVNATATKVAGDSCSADAVCKSSFCHRACVTGAPVNIFAKPDGEDCSDNSDCMSDICSAANDKKCVDINYLNGKFDISNQYSTVNFISDRECGFNSCGEKIYCLPENSHLRVELKAASLATCNSDADCASKSPYNTCDTTTKHCRKNPGNEYYPQADLLNLQDAIMGGIMDVAINSLDGNRDTFAQGPVSYYNENDLYGLCASGTNKNRQCSDTDKETTCGTAINCNGAKTLTQAQGSRDNYMWSFFINDQLDLTSPKITLTDPVTTKPDCNTTTNICTYSMADDLVKSIHTHFNKLMMSARLTTGSVTVDNGNGKIVHQLLNLKTYAQEPLAYWVTNKGFDIDPKDGEYEESDVYINHSDFSKASLYRAQAGSGLKDVYQNCYLPSASDDCAATLIGNPAQPSCCNGQATAGTSCPK